MKIIRNDFKEIKNCKKILGTYLDFKNYYIYPNLDFSLIDLNQNLISYLYFDHLSNKDLISNYLDNFNFFKINYEDELNFSLYNSKIAIDAMEINKVQESLFFGTNEILLPKNKIKLGKLDDLLLLRESTREFKRNIMSDKELATILINSFGLNDANHRTFGSGGGFYSIDLYLIINNVKEIPNGIYKYNYLRNSLEIIENNKSYNLSELCLLNGIDYLNFNCFFTFSWNSNLNRFKYSNFSLSLALIEIGLISQNIDLVSTSLNFGICQLGGFNKEKIESMVNIKDYNLNNVLHTIILGAKK